MVFNILNKSINFIADNVIAIIIIGSLIFFLPNIIKFAKEWIKKMKAEIKEDETKKSNESKK